MQMPKSVLAAAPSPKMSERYVHVNTHEVIQLMEREGFHVSAARSASPRSRDQLYARHMVEFRPNKEVVHMGATPRVVFTNSHDGTSAAQAVAGMFRFVCANGLIVGNVTETIKQRHSGDAAYELIERMRALAKNTERTFSQIERWSRIELSESRRNDFARFAAQLRWGDAAMFDPATLLEVRRPEDERPDLWTTFNVLQENTVRGGLIGLSRSGRRATSRPLTDIQRDVQYNAQLWQVASELAEL
jgi:hypothetical protein